MASLSCASPILILVYSLICGGSRTAKTVKHIGRSFSLINMELNVCKAAIRRETHRDLFTVVQKLGLSQSIADRPRARPFSLMHDARIR